MEHTRRNYLLTIVSNTCLSPGYYQMVVNAEQLARFSMPGQFCQLRVPGVYLRRPLSIAGAAKDKLSFIYKVVGTGTEALARMKPDDSLEILGPLGAGYPLTPARKKTPILVAGGSGIASINFLAQTLKRPGIIFYGARTKTELVPLTHLKKLGWKIIVATEDDSAGLKGYVTDSCRSHLSTVTCSDVVIYACGPHPMLRAVAAIAAEAHVEGYVSLEEKMACGTGICQGCVVKINGEYKRACSDGPVFAVADVSW